MTQSEKEDFRRLAKAVAKLAGGERGWTATRARAFERSWPKFRASVEHALVQPDDGVHTTRGFIHAVAGGWWEYVTSQSGGTQLSWMSFEPSADGTALTISGRGFGKGGSEVSTWETDLVSVRAELPKPILEYYWEGRHLPQSDLLFGGRGWIRFTISKNGGIDQGTGEFRDVCMDEAQRPTTKVVDLKRATHKEYDDMEGNDKRKRRAQVAKRLPPRS